MQAPHLAAGGWQMSAVGLEGLDETELGTLLLQALHLSTRQGCDPYAEDRMSPDADHLFRSVARELIRRVQREGIVNVPMDERHVGSLEN